MTKDEILANNKRFGKHLQSLREKKGLSLVKMSYNCSIDESKISKIEQGKFNITLSTLLELAKGLGIDPKDLLEF
jgi:transcriptional regulator with XRE-family HTH domain